MQCYPSPLPVVDILPAARWCQFFWTQSHEPVNDIVELVIVPRIIVQWRDLYHAVSAKIAPSFQLGLLRSAGFPIDGDHDPSASTQELPGVHSLTSWSRTPRWLGEISV